MNATMRVVSVCLLLGVTAAGSALAQGMMGSGTRGGMMGRGMMQGGDGEMMCPMMGGMMYGRTAATGMGALFGSRVVPKMNLSADAVRSYLTAQIDRLGNTRLKLG